MNKKQFNLNDHSWFIRVNTEDEFNAAVDWAESNGFKWFSNRKGFRSTVKAVSHDAYWAKGFIYCAGEHTMNMNNPRFKEIFPEFKTIKVGIVNLPAPETQKRAEDS